MRAPSGLTRPAEGLWSAGRLGPTGLTCAAERLRRTGLSGPRELRRARLAGRAERLDARFRTWSTLPGADRLVVFRP
ncbi:hypothetical protein [Nocardia yamanashiensis]|uniref:hypothetical protein n=1 Tax=Nocardia yamanashiensis TaxID=209247 RepID=UPI0022B82661|nr:hypothetical protein [Nocardia yamanashiensis]